VNLPLPSNEIAQHGNADCSAEVTGEVADAGDLIELFLRNPDKAECADSDQDERMPITWMMRSATMVLKLTPR